MKNEIINDEQGVDGEMTIWLKRLFSVVGAIAVITGLILGVNTYEAKFATAKEVDTIREDVLLLDSRLENKIREDRLHALQQRMWGLEDRYGGLTIPDASAEIRANYRELQYEAELLKQVVGGPVEWRP